MKFTKETLKLAGIGLAAVLLVGVALGLHGVQNTNSIEVTPPAPPKQTTESLIPKETEKPNVWESLCSIVVRCDDALKKKDQLPPEKQALIPQNGIIFQAENIEFSAGETVLDVFERVMRAEKMHFETATIPGTDTVYVEGIANLYEKDCGELSGWTFQVNGEMGETACNQCILSAGDVVEWVYVCDFAENATIA